MFHRGGGRLCRRFYRGIGSVAIERERFFLQGAPRDLLTAMLTLTRSGAHVTVKADHLIDMMMRNQASLRFSIYVCWRVAIHMTYIRFPCDCAIETNCLGPTDLFVNVSRPTRKPGPSVSDG